MPQQIFSIMGNMTSSDIQIAPSSETITTVRTSKRVDSRLHFKVKQMVEDRSRTSLSIDPPVPIQVVPYSKIEKGTLLGTGSFSSGISIKSLFNVPSEDLMMKKLRPEVLMNPIVFAACAADLKMEGNILATLSHENVVRLEAWSCENMIEEYLMGSFVSSYLILERLHETLESRLSKWGKHIPTFWQKFSRKRVQKYVIFQREKCKHIWSLSKAIEHFHSYRILHRDLKPPNIGFDSKGTLKVFDFDLSRVLPALDEIYPQMAYKLTALVGSLRYMAPEVNHGQPYNLKADIWSFGVIAYQILNNRKPFGGTERDWSRNNKMMPSTWTIALRTAMNGCCRRNPLERPSIDHVQELLGQQYGQPNVAIQSSRSY